jgi:outer membrane protein
LRFLLIPLLTVFLATSARAQLDSLPSSPDSALSQTLAKLEGTPLRLADVINLAVDHSTQALDARAALAAARGALKRQRGAFDPELFAGASKTSEKQPSSSPFSGADVVYPRTTAGDAGVRVTLPTGTELQASVTAQKFETNSSFASLNPQYDATGSLTIRQPLLQGFGPGRWGDFTQAKLTYDAAQQRYENAIAGVRAMAEGMYWDLYAAERDYAVALLVRDQASALLNEADARAQAGLVGPNQVNNAKVFLAQQELAVLDAGDNRSHVSDQLASLMGVAHGGAAARYRTAEAPPLISVIESEDSVLARAMRTNHELNAADADVKAAAALLKAATWNALPKADLFAALGGNGLSGVGRNVIFGTDTLPNSLNTPFSDAVDQALRRDYPTWMVGIQVSVPILLREKGGERDRLRAELRRAEQRYLRTRHDLEENVRANYRELANGQRRVQMAQNGVQAASDQVRIGVIEFKNGTTTAFELVRLGADLADTQRRYSQALVRTAKAAAVLKQLAPEETSP